MAGLVAVASGATGKCTSCCSAETTYVVQFMGCEISNGLLVKREFIQVFFHRSDPPEIPEAGLQACGLRRLYALFTGQVTGKGRQEGFRQAIRHGGKRTWANCGVLRLYLQLACIDGIGYRVLHHGAAGYDSSPLFKQERHGLLEPR